MEGITTMKIKFIVIGTLISLGTVLPALAYWTNVPFRAPVVAQQEELHYARPAKSVFEISQSYSVEPAPTASAIVERKKAKSVLVIRHPDVIKHKDCEFHTLEQGGGEKVPQVLICQ